MASEVKCKYGNYPVHKHTVCSETMVTAEWRHPIWTHWSTHEMCSNHLRKFIANEKATDTKWYAVVRRVNRNGVVTVK